MGIFLSAALWCQELPWTRSPAAPNLEAVGDAMHVLWTCSLTADASLAQVKILQ